MPIYKLEFQTQINTSPQTVYEHLKNPQNFVGLQPLLTHVENIEHEEKDGKQSVSYDTVEAFRWLGIVLYKNRIHVQTVFTNPPHQLDTMVHSFPNITIHVEYIFTPQNEGTFLKETMQIEVSAWLAKFVTTQANQAQIALLANLKNRLESKIN
jgi:carbon monoxide dehydrogenase subunit G